MKALLLQHAPFEGPGRIRPWLESHGAQVEVLHLDAGAPLPSPASADLVIAMGGPMSANDEASLPWLRAEKQFLAEVVAEGRPLLGVCLGAQLIASALGAAVYPAPQREIGWLPVQSTGAHAGLLPWPKEMMVFQWHGETFDLPAGAVRLAGSAACPNQAFQVGRRAIALQFHLEMTAEAVEAMIAHCGQELQPGAFTATAAQMRAAGAELYREAQAQMAATLAYLIGA